MEAPPPTREQLEPDTARLEAEAARETEEQQRQQQEEGEGVTEEEAPATPGVAEGGELEEEAEEEEEESDEEEDDTILESDDDDENAPTSEAETLRRKANREAEAKLCQRLLGDLREEVASLETDEWELEKPRFG